LENYGPDHPNTLGSLKQLGTSLFASGKTPRSEKYLGSAIRTNEKRLWVGASINIGEYGWREWMSWNVAAGPGMFRDYSGSV
jgi:hypothetical protein